VHTVGLSMSVPPVCGTKFVAAREHRRLLP